MSCADTSSNRGLCPPPSSGLADVLAGRRQWWIEAGDSAELLATLPNEGVVLDPFTGSGTTLLVALRHGRRAIGLELNPKYVEMASRRIFLDAPLFNTPTDTEAAS